MMPSQRWEVMLSDIYLFPSEAAATLLPGKKKCDDDGDDKEEEEDLGVCSMR